MVYQCGSDGWSAYHTDFCEIVSCEEGKIWCIVYIVLVTNISVKLVALYQ